MPQNKAKIGCLLNHACNLQNSLISASVSTTLTTFSRWRISVNGWLNMWKVYSRGQESYYRYHQINVFTLTLVLLKALRHNETKLSIKWFNQSILRMADYGPNIWKRDVVIREICFRSHQSSCFCFVCFFLSIDTSTIWFWSGVAFSRFIW